MYDVGSEPDPRFSLANERTFLAWIRTALAMVAGGVALHALDMPGAHWVKALLVVGLIILGALVCIGSTVRWARVERAIRRREPLPAFGLGVAMTIALVVVAGLLVFALI